MSLPITAIILAHQQNQKFSNALDSVKWAEKILIVWSSNKKIDPTLLPENAEVIETTFPIFHFADVRNMAAHHAKSEWLFFLDSDEVLTPDSVAVIEQILAEPDIDAAYVKRKDFFLGKEIKWGEMRNVKVLRLIRRQFSHFSRAVHEIVEIHENLVESQIVIHHYAHDSISSFLTKVIFYMQIEARYRQEQKIKTRIYQLFVYPPGKFLQNFILRLGFLDGWRGFIYALMMSIHSFGVRALIYEQKV